MKSLTLAFALALAWTGDGQAQTASARPVQTEIAPPHTVFVRDLIGLTPAQVQRRLSGLDADWPRTTGLEVQTERGLLSFATVHDYLRDPAAVERDARFRSRADHGSSTLKVWSGCDVTPAPDTAVLMFRDGRLESVWSRPPAGADSSFHPAAGALPLEDGDAVLAHWGQAPMDADTSLTIRCTRREAAAVVRPRSSQAGQGQRLSASDMQGLALLPFAPALPVMNAQRNAPARGRGPLRTARPRIPPARRLADLRRRTRRGAGDPGARPGLCGAEGRLGRLSRP